MLALSFVKGTYWYNTILAYPAGYIYYSYRSCLERWLKRNYLPAIIALVVVFVYIHDYLPFSYRGLPENIMGIIFALIVVMITMKVQIGNKWLRWCGTNLFPLYIYQRIPMIALVALLGNKFVSSYPVVFLVLSIAITCLIARYYKYWSLK